MKLNYEVEWELEDEVIESIVEEVENILKQYPDYDIDDCIYNTAEDFLDNLSIEACDHFNIDCYLGEVTEEVKSILTERMIIC